ncbi:MAG: OmpA family protein [Woeseiaceae bacterium]
MLVKHRRILGVVLSFLLLAGAVLLSEEAVVATDAASGDAPELTLKYGRQKLQLTMTSVSVEHEEAILQVISEQFAGMQVRVDFQTATLAESDWGAVSNRLLYLVGATSSAEVSFSSDIIQIRGTSDNAELVQQRLAWLREALPAGAPIDASILTTDTSMTSAELCARSFAPIAAQTIHFRQSSTELRDAAIPLLDRLVEFAYDCPDSIIAIVGHTDSTGEELWNVQVSLARAEIVAAYVTSRGIASNQLVTEGAGSERPIGDNGSVAGRERNRRIDFELR